MPFTYTSGLELLKGDRVRLGSYTGIVEFIADPANPTQETEWYISEFGGGVMIVTKEIGPVFMSRGIDNDLTFEASEPNT